MNHITVQTIKEVGIPAGSGSGMGAGLPHAVAAAARKASIFGGGIG